MRRRYSVKKCCVNHQGRLRWTPDEITEGPSNFKERLLRVLVWLVWDWLAGWVLVVHPGS